jgi:hypothetical protein
MHEPPRRGGLFGTQPEKRQSFLYCIPIGFWNISPEAFDAIRRRNQVSMLAVRSAHEYVRNDQFPRILEYWETNRWESLYTLPDGTVIRLVTHGDEAQGEDRVTDVTVKA